MNQTQLILTDRQLCDLEMIMSKAFYPLDGFIGEDDYYSILDNMRLVNGSLWPIPIILDVSKKFSKQVSINDKIILKDKEGFPVAEMNISDIWQPNKKIEAEKVYGTLDESHPGVDYLLNQTNSIYIGGLIKCIESIHHYDYQYLRHSPKELKDKFKKLGWNKVIAFQTRNPLHKAHVEMTLRAIKDAKAKLLIHPVVGMTKPGDVDYHTRVRCYNHILKKYPITLLFLV